MKEVVIWIPDEIYKDIKNWKIHNFDYRIPLSCILEGTVLSKGHGELIDREKLKSFRCAEHSSDKEDIDDYETEEERDTARDREDFYRTGWNDAVEFIIEKAPVAIPADKGE